MPLLIMISRDKNTDTGYQLIIDDEADFLTSDEGRKPF